MSSSLSGIKKLKYDKEHEHELAMYEKTRTDLKVLLAEVINYNKVNLERLEQNESRQRNRQKGMTKRKEEKEW